jgi:hypothetical protein
MFGVSSVVSQVLYLYRIVRAISLVNVNRLYYKHNACNFLFVKQDKHDFFRIWELFY